MRCEQYVLRIQKQNIEESLAAVSQQAPQGYTLQQAAPSDHSLYERMLTPHMHAEGQLARQYSQMLRRVAAGSA
jgi:23S rRNA maturation-related 3'-5' exoribonuclease YhaM